MALCPEVLALIVATALLSRHHGAQREREIEQQGRLALSANTHQRAGPPTSSPAYNWQLSSDLYLQLCWNQKKRSACSKQKIAYRLSVNTNKIIFKEGLHLWTDSKSFFLHVAMQCKPDCSVSKSSKYSKPDCLLLVPVWLKKKLQNALCECYLIWFVFRTLLHARNKQLVTMIWMRKPSMVSFSSWGANDQMQTLGFTFLTRSHWE